MSFHVRKNLFKKGKGNQYNREKSQSQQRNFNRDLRRPKLSNTEMFMLNQTSHITGDYWDRSAHHHRVNTTDQIQRSFSPRNLGQRQFPPTTPDLRQHLDQRRQQLQIQQQQWMRTYPSTSGPQPARDPRPRIVLPLSQTWMEADWTTLGPPPTSQLNTTTVEIKNWKGGQRQQ